MALQHRRTARASTWCRDHEPPRRAPVTHEACGVSRPHPGQRRHRRPPRRTPIPPAGLVGDRVVGDDVAHRVVEDEALGATETVDPRHPDEHRTDLTPAVGCRDRPRDDIERCRRGRGNGLEALLLVRVGQRTVEQAEGCLEQALHTVGAITEEPPGRSHLFDLALDGRPRHTHATATTRVSGRGTAHRRPSGTAPSAARCRARSPRHRMTR